MVMSSRSTLFLSRGWLLKSAPASVVMSIPNGFNPPLCTLALSRKDHVSSTTNWTLLSRRDWASAWWGTRLWVRELHPVFVQDMAWRRVVSCRQPLPRHIPPTNSVASCDPRYLPKVSLHRKPYIVYSCETPRHVCVRVCVFMCCHIIYSGRQTCGRTSRGHTGGRSYRISPPSFCGV